MSPKWVIRIGILLVFIVITYFGYSAKKSYEDSLKPASTYYHSPEVEKFRFDVHGHAYRGLDDSDTLYHDDPKLHRNTVVGARKDLTLPKPLTVEDIKKKRKDQPTDEFYIKGTTTQDRDDRDSLYMGESGAYGGSMPDRY